MTEHTCALREERGKGTTSGPKKNSNRKLGTDGELAAVAFLRRQGFRILETNWRCIIGEVDIIAADDRAIHFIEVKTRRGVRFGFPSEAVTREKRERYERMALIYLEHYEGDDIAICFDVISIVQTGRDHACLRIVRNAFALE